MNKLDAVTKELILDYLSDDRVPAQEKAEAQGRLEAVLSLIQAGRFSNLTMQTFLAVLELTHANVRVIRQAGLDVESDNNDPNKRLGGVFVGGWAPVRCVDGELLVFGHPVIQESFPVPEGTSKADALQTAVRRLLSQEARRGDAAYWAAHTIDTWWDQLVATTQEAE